MSDAVGVIEHSGGIWRASRRGPNRNLVWPIEECLARRSHSRAVADRIRRLNPDGKEEGARARGWNPARRSSGLRWGHHAVSVREFINAHGCSAYRALPRSAFIRDGHRKVIKMTAFVQAR